MTSSVIDEPVYGPAPLGATNGMQRETPAAPATAPADDAGQVNTRFLQFLIPAAATVASTFGPQIGSAIGGLIGGSSGSDAGGKIGGAVGGVLGSLGGGVNLGGLFGGRGFLPESPFDNWNPAANGIVAQPIDVLGPMIQQCTLQCVNKITPELAQTLKAMAPQLKPSGERSAVAEIAAVERFWPEIASFLTQKVASHLPGVIKTVTSTVLPLLGTRDSAQFTPVLTGTEAHARWFVPVLTSVLTAVQQNLPKLLDVLDGDSRAVRSSAVTWKDLSEYGRFWDNDFIRVVGQEKIADPDAVEFVLELAPHLSWAKELQIRDDNGALIKRLRVQDSTKWAQEAVAADQILTNGSLLFAKAKMFGVMTGMYVLPTAGLNELRGKRTHVRWMAD